LLHEPSLRVFIQHFRTISCFNYEHYIIIKEIDLVHLREKIYFDASGGVTLMLLYVHNTESISSMKMMLGC
jgi:hypothetical protein